MAGPFARAPSVPGSGGYAGGVGGDEFQAAVPGGGPGEWRGRWLDWISLRPAARSEEMAFSFHSLEVQGRRRFKAATHGEIPADVLSDDRHHTWMTSLPVSTASIRVRCPTPSTSWG